MTDDFSLEMTGDARGRRPTRRRKTSKSLGIQVGGFVIFGLIGAAIGYYIVMLIRPGWNVWDIPLPGL
jgi:hypothetical protein